MAQRLLPSQADSAQSPMPEPQASHSVIFPKLRFPTRQFALRWLVAVREIIIRDPELVAWMQSISRETLEDLADRDLRVLVSRVAVRIFREYGLEVSLGEVLGMLQNAGDVDSLEQLLMNYYSSVCKPGDLLEPSQIPSVIEEVRQSHERKLTMQFLLLGVILGVFLSFLVLDSVDLRDLERLLSGEVNIIQLLWPEDAYGDIEATCNAYHATSGVQKDGTVINPCPRDRGKEG
ncbi:hypothetical protein KC640_02220 [Candidatus Dojkabacteria bacterium]|uniref:Uncharacterized protein n=1 Tax=Candidatus Dojkabacteria bacterium TaxID=2099670 RepID=A0A955L0I2_9BACT|nr:hypothetical protein [Candidatus Dojkabacteria bacterium]